MRDAVIVSAVRTPTGKFLGALKDLTAPQLGALVVCRSGAPRRHRPRHRRRVHHGQRRLRRIRAESGAPGGAQGRPARPRRGAHDQQSLRVGAEGGDARPSGDRDRRHRRRRRRRHGVDEQLPVPPAAGARRPAHGPRRDRGLDDQRRPLVRVRAVPHGERGRSRGRALPCRPRRAGRVRRAQPSEGGPGDRCRAGSRTRSFRCPFRSERATRWW